MVIYFRFPLNTYQQEHRNGIDNRHVHWRLEFCVQTEGFPFKTPIKIRVSHSQDYFHSSYGAFIIHSIEDNIEMHRLFSYRIRSVLIQFSLIFSILIHFLFYPSVCLDVICSYSAFHSFFLTCYISPFFPSFPIFFQSCLF